MGKEFRKAFRIVEFLKGSAVGSKTRFSMEFSGQLAIGFCIFLRPP